MRSFSTTLIIFLFIAVVLAYECYSETSSLVPKEWQIIAQKDRGDHYVADVLVLNDKSKEYFIDEFKNIFKALSSKTAVIRVYTSKEAYVKVQHDAWDDIARSGYIIYYVKGKYSSEIRWMAEKGKFGSLFGTKTEIR